ncbi:outer membrane lipoprotein carrier protein LolA [Wohlfahrtiimonas chitiniclastica]|uniref:outer membrane lipoprotein chaperone LolA n=1 Tax=Wohlfahrtiimonas chitiniclastica TaxID=400946 RepID=UPI000B992774|nr:outer membrane lipoprotein chaperone LolA [Wohlfahrtiimonas chitiniclastica]MDC7252042.1 outer-membrane lipoprotein carrier protein [Wohlfahrtiimonas chitiniclastica]OYQ87942.1 outer membrane lipoprotein carrier protein LolA [Wohlfahrtiimonas chitiniclastica]
MLKTVSLWSILTASLVVPSLANEAFVVRYFNDLTSLQADFEQTVTQQKNKEISDGILQIRKKNGRDATAGFYFNYTSPFEQKIISNGQKLWHYDVDLEQVVIKNLAIFEQDSPMFMIFNDQPLNAQFAIKTLKNEQKYRLTPKKKGDVEFIEIEFKRGNISNVYAKQANGTLSLTLSDVVINQTINPNVFTLKVPKGVDVIDETK